MCLVWRLDSNEVELEHINEVNLISQYRWQILVSYMGFLAGVARKEGTMVARGEVSFIEVYVWHTDVVQYPLQTSSLGVRKTRESYNLCLYY